MKHIKTMDRRKTALVRFGEKGRVFYYPEIRARTV